MLWPFLQLSGEMQAAMTESGREHELVERARQGDRAAFDELASAVAGGIVGRIRRRLGPALRGELDPEDVAQEALYRAFRSLREFRWQGAGSFEAWVHGIALRIVLYAGRERGKWKLLRISREPAAEDVSPSRGQRREERFERLERALERLSAEQRDVVQLVRLEGLSIAQAAERLERTPASVRGLLFRAMKSLRQSFGDTESLGLPDRCIAPRREGEGDGVV
jgi:RNA polymerase sigma-70 factor (ECF subfamily)